MCKAVVHVSASICIVTFLQSIVHNVGHGHVHANMHVSCFVRVVLLSGCSALSVELRLGWSA